MPPRKARQITIPPLDPADPLLAGVKLGFLSVWSATRAVGHVSASLLYRQGTARLFVADRLLSLWGVETNAVSVTGDKRLGAPHLLNDARFKAVCSALDEYPNPHRIANAIRAYAAHCRTNAERIKNPSMRLTFDRFLSKGLETWILVGDKLDAANAAGKAKVADANEHAAFLSRWSKLDNADQRRLMMDAVRQLDQSRTRYGAASTSDPVVRGRLLKLMEAR